MGVQLTVSVHPAQACGGTNGVRSPSCRTIFMTTALREELKQWLERLKREEALDPERYRNRQISRRIKKHLWLSNRSWARDVHSFGILHSWGALAGKSCSAQASSIWLIAGAFRRTQSK